MAIRDLQIRLTQVGKIRLGISPEANGSKNPGKLDTFRFTSPAEHLIIEIARQYGGQCRPWKPQGGGAPQFEVITQTARVPVQVPRQNVEPWYEQWGRGVCQRRCDGVKDTIQREDCPCDPDNRACKPTTRLTVGLSDVPGLGVWLLESHGWNAAAELSGLTGILQMLPEGIRLPGILVLEQRGDKKIGPDPRNPDRQIVLTRDYRVPVVHFDAITMRAIHAGSNAIAQALGQATNQPALQASTEQNSRQILRARLLEQIQRCDNAGELNAIGHEAKNAGIADSEFVDAWRAGAARLNAPISGGGSARPELGPDEVLNNIPSVVELPGDDFDPDEEFNLILTRADGNGWKTDDVIQKVLEFCGVTPDQATGQQLHDFRMAMKARQIQ